MKDLDIALFDLTDKDVAVDKNADKALVKKYVYYFLKRTFDFVVSFFMMIPIVLLCIVIKVINILSKDNGPVFYTQKRIGENGKTFKMYKFRTMCVNADEVLKEMLKDKKYKNEWDKYHKFDDDPRITKIGAFLRKYSIDELPQFINVFKGEMSIIGNRPYLLSEKENMGRYYDKIILTKPGITGLWQTSGRNDITFKRRCIIEAYYSCIVSVRLDIKIFFKTFKVVLFGRGAK